MRRLLLLLTVALVMAAIMAFSALPALAQVPPHQHFLTTPAGTHEVAGGIACAAHEPAFTNFHENVHQGAPPVPISATLC
jgi:hypothetical protein